MTTPLEEALERLVNRVPEVTLVFWILKILATTVGETAGDVLSITFKLGTVVTSYVMGALLLITLGIQFRARRYVPWIYWLVVVFISVVGTLISDNLVDNLGVPLTTTTAIFMVALILVFVFWYMSEKTLSVHTIFTHRREAFYWAAILFTFSLGTSGGDLLSERMAVGYALSAVIFAAGIAIIYGLYRMRVIGEVLAFWLAYILTRPLGASMGDLLTQARADGGLGLGTIPVSAVFLLIIVILVVHLTREEKKLAQANPLP
ncbi:MAG: hypothetical protein DMD63_15080 [Gemmatimonadetes bacterium]|nr:MAG: hypothetical protein DMD63_15080 [Gemmatimonadota bacterium]